MGLLFRPQDLCFKPQGLRSRLVGLRFKPQGLRFRLLFFGFKPPGLRFRRQLLWSSVFGFESSFYTHPRQFTYNLLASVKFWQIFHEMPY